MQQKDWFETSKSGTLGKSKIQNNGKDNRAQVNMINA